MNTVRPKAYVVRLYLAALFLFMANKFAIRPFVLEQDSPQLIQIVVLQF